jgi:hypothetical protein
VNEFSLAACSGSEQKTSSLRLLFMRIENFERHCPAGADRLSPSRKISRADVPLAMPRTRAPYLDHSLFSAKHRDRSRSKRILRSVSSYDVSGHCRDRDAPVRYRYRLSGGLKMMLAPGLTARATTVAINAEGARKMARSAQCLDRGGNVLGSTRLGHRLSLLCGLVRRREHSAAPTLLECRSVYCSAF